ncbi:MAG: TolC family protein, partial [Bryobacteraceae bacterium]
DQRSAFSRAVVLVQVRRAFFLGLRARSVLRVAEKTVQTRQVVADQIGALAKSNLKSGLDVSFANVNLAEAKLLLSQAQNEVKGADAELSAAMGYPLPQEFDLVETAMPAPPLAEPAPMISIALKERADVQSARSELSAAQRFTSAEGALSRPTVSIGAAAGVAPVHGDSIKDHYSIAGITMSIPIFNGHLYSARREEADFRARAVAERVRSLEMQVARDVQVAWLNTTNSFKRVKLTDELVKQASLALELSQARYDLGLSSIVELTQAQLAKTAADIQRATAIYEFQIQTSVLAYQQGLLK